MAILTTHVYILEKNYILLKDGQDRWVLTTYHVNALGQCLEMAIRQRHLEHTSTLFELSVSVGTMSRANCVSLVELAKSGALKLHRTRFGNSPAGSVVGRLHEQGIVEQMF